MNIKKIIDGLYFTVGMMLFNPATGEAKTPDELNEDDRYTYDACMGAIELLKAQEPRVMTLEELVVDDVVWLEDCDKETTVPGIYCDRNDTNTIFATRMRGYLFVMNDEYGKRWRCWTSRQTDEQREATPWN